MRREKMIKNIDELKAYLLELSHKFGGPREAPDLVLTSPGCSKGEIEELKKALPGIPDSYIKWVEAINLNGVSVGYFGVSPSSYNPEGMVANLLEGNEEGVLFWEYMRQYHLYSVATTDGYGIFVATSSSPYKEGEIIAIAVDIYGDKEKPDKWIYRLSKDFEQFLIVGGNLNQLHREIIKDDSKYMDKKEEFLECLKNLNVSEDYQGTWLKFFYQ
jgi:hypothetical protein